MSLSATVIRAFFNYKNPIQRILSGHSIRESILNDDLDLDEKAVKLGGQVFPKSGYCCVLAGGAGSGKGFIQSTKILADFKVLDVDFLKKLYRQAVAVGVIDDEHGDYDLANPEDVSTLHAKVKELGWDKKRESWFFDYCAANGKLPNVLFDITGRETVRLTNIGRTAKAVGYSVVLVWVVTPRQVAIIQNLSRDRKVGQKVFHSVHNAVITSVFSFLKGLAYDYDQAFIVFNPGRDLSSLPPEMQEVAKKYDVVELEKSGSSFIIPPEIEADILSFLGKTDDPDAPSVYKDFKDIDVSAGPSNVFK